MILASVIQSHIQESKGFGGVAKEENHSSDHTEIPAATRIACLFIQVTWQKYT